MERERRRIERGRTRAAVSGAIRDSGRFKRTPRRPDVSYNANPGTGYAIYDSVGISGVTGWFQVGGTSAGTPQWAALIAIANSSRAALREVKPREHEHDSLFRGEGEYRDEFSRRDAGYERQVRRNLRRAAGI